MLEFARFYGVNSNFGTPSATSLANYFGINVLRNGTAPEVEHPPPFGIAHLTLRELY